MSSLFNLPTSENIADPSSATDRIVHEEVTPRSSSLDGAVTIEFTSSPQRWYSPSDSYVLIGFNVHASDGAGAFTAVDYDSAVPYVGATIAQNAGANFFSAVTLSVNGVLMGTLSSPAQVSGLITKSELSARIGKLIREFSELQGCILVLNDERLTKMMNDFEI